MASLLTRILLIEVCVALVIFLSGVPLLANDNENFLSNFFNTQLYQQTGQISTQGTSLESNTQATSDGLTKTSGSLLSFIDVVSSIVAFLKFLLLLLFLPIGILTSIGLPSTLALLFGVPLTILNVMGFIYLVRSGS